MPKSDAVAFFSAFFGGEHHIPGKVRECGAGWCVNMGGELATFDGSDLTRLSFLAHDRAVRVAVRTAGMRLQITIHQRERGGGTWSRHPTIEAALATWRKTWPEVS